MEARVQGKEAGGQDENAGGNVSGNMLTRSSLGALDVRFLGTRGTPNSPVQARAQTAGPRRRAEKSNLQSWGCGNGWILRDRVEFVVGSGAMPPVQDKRRRAASTVSGPEAVTHQDFLAEYAEKAQLSPPALESVRAWLAQQFVADEFAKLEQGGHAETRVALRRVFIDLPVGDQPIAMVTSSGARTPFLSILGQTEPTSLSSLCDVPVSVDATMFDAMDSNESPAGGFLLIGGPGQGKSTLGQLACQLHRAVLLRGKRILLTSQVRAVLAPFEDTTHANESLDKGMQLPASPLLPLRVALPEFASWMADPKTLDGSEPALLRFLMSRRSVQNTKLHVGTLEALCAVMPCFLVLDGFDEVGAAEDRERIVEAARELLTSLGKKNGKALVVATTRPQGYTGELERIGIPVVKKYLAHLDVKTALRYAKKVIEAKVVDLDKQAEIFSRLEEASEDDTTARLLRTPLQATILAALVQQGRAPSERWQLFQKYFDLLYDREVNHDSYASELLSSHRPQIKEIHRRVALLLQVEAEQAGGGGRMSRERLSSVVDTVLAEDEVADDARAELVGRIVDAAEKRLVFLVEPEPGQFGFELQSLQEFMAAWLLSEGRDAGVIENRWLHIARAPLFRNVAIFMASRFFSDRLAMRDLLAERICVFLDEEADPLTKATKTGALLALEALEEGSASNQPKRARALMERAVALLELPAANEHVRLAYAMTEETSAPLLLAIEMRLAKGAADPSVDTTGAWICVLALSSCGYQWTTELALFYWSPVFHAPMILEACRAASLEVHLFVLFQILRTPELFDPYELITSDILEVSEWNDGAWLGMIIEGFRPAPKRKAPPRIGIWLLTPLPIRVQVPDDDVTDALATLPAKWRPWLAAAKFHGAPSATTLATALRVVAENCASRDDWAQLATKVAWPLAACLNTADKPSDLIRFADMATARDLGDIEQWLARAQNSEGGPIFDAVVDGLPWTVDSLHKALPFTALRLNDACVYQMRQEGAEALFTKAAEKFENLTSPRQRAHAAKVCLSLLPRVVQWRSIDAEQVQVWVDASKGNPDELPRPCDLFTTDWMQALVMLGQRAQVNEAPSLTEVIDAFLHAPKNRTLLGMVLLSIVLQPKRAKNSLSILAHESRRQLGETLRVQTFPTGDAQIYALALRVYLGLENVNVETVMVQFAAFSTDSPTTWSLLISAIDRGEAPAAFKESLLLSMFARPDIRWQERAQIVYAMNELLAETRRSGLDSTTTWNQLQLPLPHPMITTGALRTTTIPVDPVVITELHVHHVRGLHELELKFVPPEPGKGQWIVFLGENGMGKTTILRSLVLGLRNLQDPKIWPRGAFESPWRQVDGPSNGRIDITLANQGTYTTHIRSNGSETFVQPEFDASRLIPLFAYGCRRGSAFGGAQREVQLNDDDGPEVATLFHEGASLIHAETWLIAWDGDAAKNDDRKKIYDVILVALRSILGLDKIEVSNQRVWVKERNKPMVPFKALSDGYVTMAGWVIDLIARWIPLAERYKWVVDEHFMHRMTGLVLIDEIDLFLHPRWQEQVIDDVRKIFPKMTFIVTTHHGLTLRGAKDGEIFVLGDHEGHGKVTAIQRDIPKGTRIDQLVTGQWFNRPSAIIDQDTRDKLDKHQQLILSGAKAGDPERKELEEALRQRLGQFADTSLERLTANIVAQHLKDHFPEPSAEKREQVRDEVLAILARRETKQTAKKKG